MNDAELTPGPGRLDQANSRRLLWVHVMKPGRDYRDALQPSYWRACAGQLAPMHRIEVWSADFRICFEAIVLECNQHATPHPRVDLYFRPILPEKLDLPAEPIIAPARWVAEQLSINGNWLVRDTVTGATVQQDLSKYSAQTLVGTLETAAAQAEEERQRRQAA